MPNYLFSNFLAQALKFPVKLQLKVHRHKLKLMKIYSVQRGEPKKKSHLTKNTFFCDVIFENKNKIKKIKD